MHDALQLDRAGGLDWSLERVIGCAALLRPLGPRGCGQRGEFTKRRNRCGAGRQHGLVRVIDAAQFLGAGIDMHDALAGLHRVQHLVAASDDVAQTAAQNDERICRVEHGLEGWVDAKAEVSDIVRVAVVHIVLTAEGGGDGQGICGGEFHQRCTRICRPTRPARDQKRTRRRLNRGHDGTRVRAGHTALCGGHCRAIRHIGHVAEHIFGQGDDDRAGAPSAGHVESAGKVFGQALGLVNLARPFGKRSEKGAVVDFLKRAAIPVGARDLTDKHDHWRRILHRDVNTGGRIRRPRPARHEQHARCAGQLAMRLGHHRGAAFLTTDHVFDPAVIKPI